MISKNAFLVEISLAMGRTDKLESRSRNLGAQGRPVMEGIEQIYGGMNEFLDGQAISMEIFKSYRNEQGSAEEDTLTGQNYS